MKPDPRTQLVKTMSVGDWFVELLPKAAYEANYTSKQYVIGFSFDRQFGTHSFASDHREPYQANPNTLATVPIGCDVYSQSTKGGEYLKVNCANFHTWERYGESQLSGIVNANAIKASYILRWMLLSSIQKSLLDYEQQLQILELCALDVLSKPEQNSSSKGWFDNARFNRFDEIVEAKLDSRITIADIATEFDLSTAYLSREFKKFVGQTPHQYIVTKRLGRARHLLQNPNVALSSIALDCGYASHSHMTEHFRVKLGVTPTQFRSDCLPHSDPST